MLGQVEVLQGKGITVSEAVRQVGVTQQTLYRWRKRYGGMGRSHIVRLKMLEKVKQRLPRAVSDGAAIFFDLWLLLTHSSEGKAR